MFMGSYQESMGSVGADVLVPQDVKIAQSAPMTVGGLSIGEVILYGGLALIGYVALKQWLYPSE
jgi:hypothetical protein